MRVSYARNSWISGEPAQAARPHISITVLISPLNKGGAPKVAADLVNLLLCSLGQRSKPRYGAFFFQRLLQDHSVSVSRRSAHRLARQLCPVWMAPLLQVLFVVGVLSEAVLCSAC